MSSHSGLHQTSTAVQLIGNVPPPSAPCLGRCFLGAGQCHGSYVIPEWPCALWRLVENTMCSPQDKRGTVFSSLKKLCSHLLETLCKSSEMGSAFSFLCKMQLGCTFLMLAVREQFGFKFLILFCEKYFYEQWSPFY